MPSFRLASPRRRIQAETDSRNFRDTDRHKRAKSSANVKEEGAAQITKHHVCEKLDLPQISVTSRGNSSGTRTPSTSPPASTSCTRQPVSIAVNRVDTERYCHNCGGILFGGNSKDEQFQGVSTGDTERSQAWLPKEIVIRSAHTSSIPPHEGELDSHGTNDLVVDDELMQASRMSCPSIDPIYPSRDVIKCSRCWELIFTCTPSSGNPDILEPSASSPPASFTTIGFHSSRSYPSLLGPQSIAKPVAANSENLHPNDAVRKRTSVSSISSTNSDIRGRRQRLKRRLSATPRKEEASPSDSALTSCEEEFRGNPATLPPPSKGTTSVRGLKMLMGLSHQA